MVPDSSSNERIVSTQCGIKHEWRLNGTLLPDTGCVLFPKDTGLYSVATVVNGCVSSIYNGVYGYYRVTDIPKRVEWQKPLAGVKCIVNNYTVYWSSSPIISKVKISVRKPNESSFNTIATDINTTQNSIALNIKKFKPPGICSIKNRRCNTSKCI